MKKSRSDDQAAADAAHDAAFNRLCGAGADQFARDLDTLGWKIVSQFPLEPGEPPHAWPMNGTKGPCPAWADDLFNKPSKPVLRLIDGGTVH